MSVNNYPAIIPESGRIISVIREDKLLCRYRCIRKSRYNEIVIAEPYSNSAYTLVSQVKNATVSRRVHTGIIGFNLSSGKYDLWPEWSEFSILNKLFKDTVAVDEYNLTLGLVPDSFKNVLGYASNILKFEELVKIEPKINTEEQSVYCGYSDSSIPSASVFPISPSIGFFL
jgi:hypothetical protein